MSVTLSSQACPEAREYERTSTAIANAYVQPLMSGYLRRLAREMSKLGLGVPIHLMTSGGSLASLETAARFPVRLVESGPAGGAILAGRIALERGERRILSFDMGGTTAKICLIDDGEALKARVFEVDRQSRFKKGSGTPVRIPIIEMVEIGAGGGSIARVDSLQRILVGPDSAGAEPGPACYGRGGTEPTVTDADLVIGKIDAARFAGGKIAIDPASAERALVSGVGAKLAGMDAEQAAVAVAEIVDENMANAARVHAVERGVAIAERTLVAFGGAAPLHASRLAEKLGITPHHRAAGCRRRLGGRVPGGAGGLRDRALALYAARYVRRGGRQCARRRHAAGSCGPCARGGRRAARAGEAVRLHALCRAGPRDHDCAAGAPPGSGRRGHVPGRVRARVCAAVRPVHSQCRNRDHELGGAGDDGDRAAQPARGGCRAPCAGACRRAQRVRCPARPAHRRAGIRAPSPGAGRDDQRAPRSIVEEGTSTYASPSFDISVDAGGALVLTARTAHAEFRAQYAPR